MIGGNQVRGIFVCSMNRPVSQYEGTVLLAAAKYCYRTLRSASGAIRFRTDQCEGRVETSWSCAALEHLAGPVFRAELDGEDASYRVTYIVRSVEFDELQAFLAAVGDDALPVFGGIALEILETTFSGPTSATLN